MDLKSQGTLMWISFLFEFEHVQMIDEVADVLLNG